MPRLSIREIKLRAGTVHQALCRDCRYAGPERPTIRLAEDDAEGHVLKPEFRNHQVGISTRRTQVKAFKKRSR